MAVCLCAAPVRADCSSRSLLSTCLDADTFWPHAGPTTFTFIGGADVTAPGRLGAGLVSTYLRRPIVFEVPSADPAGNQIDAVDHAIDSTFLWSYGLVSRLDISAAVSTVSYRIGTGVSSLADQTTQDLSHTVLRDTRVGASYALLPDASGPLRAAARLEMSVPTGDDRSFAGEASVVGIPAVSFELHQDRWLAAAELGARLRRTSDLLGARVGSQLFFGLGAGVHAVTPEILSFLVEAVALPTLVEQRRAAYDPRVDGYVEWSTGKPLVPAEWALSVRSVPVPDSGFSVALSGGGRLPLTPDAGVTTPAYRFSLGLRYAPTAR
jgi:OmpA-OmpF porin, OOP family